MCGTHPLYSPPPLPPPITKKRRQTVTTNSNITKKKVDISPHIQRFKNLVRNKIIKNKRYPRIAKRRGIDGTVHVVFDIQSDGTVTNIRTSGASMLLQKAVKKSIKKSFPIDIPNIIKKRFPMRNVSVNVDFILK